MTRKDDDPFAIAKRALHLIGEFGTPPTPEVYEVWYTYAAGSNDALTKQLDFAVKEARAVSAELLKSIHEQFCMKVDNTYGRVGDVLASELEQIQSLVVRQREAGTVLADSMDVAEGGLAGKSPTGEVIAQCISQIQEGTSKMRAQLSEVSETLGQSRQKISSLQSELTTAQRGMMTDHLTGAGNRRYFDSLMQQAVENFNEDDSDLVYLVLIDLDHFKQINDAFGHDVGDKLLQVVARQISALRPEASVARLGGDEFAAFVRVGNRDEVIEFTEGIQDHFSELSQSQASPFASSITFSIGVARLRPSDDPASWYQRADKLLYQAKDLGRNRAVVEVSIG